MVPENIHTNSMEGHQKLLGGGGGGGVVKAKLLEEKYEVKLEFPGGVRECRTKNLPWGEYGYFLELHNERIGGFKITLAT